MVEGNPARVAAARAGYLSTSGNQIVDATGQSVRIAGVNWFGFETTNFAPHGLWTRGYKDMMDQMKQLGFNTIRLPFSDQTLRRRQHAQRHRLRKNPDLQGLTGLQIMDKIVAYAGQIGLRIILDHHRSDAGAAPTARPLVHAQPIPRARWITDWTMLAHALRQQPDGHRRRPAQRAARPGHLGRRRRQRLAAGRRARRQRHPRGQPQLADLRRGRRAPTRASSYWWGGNLMGGATVPVRLNVANRLVYSPHDYPASVYAQPWFSDPTIPTTCRPLGQELGLPLQAEHRAGLLGEFGTKLDRPRTSSGCKVIIAYLGGDLDGNGTRDLAAGQQGHRAGRSGRGTPTPATPAASSTTTGPR